MCYFWHNYVHEQKQHIDCALIGTILCTYGHIISKHVIHNMLLPILIFECTDHACCTKPFINFSISVLHHNNIKIAFFTNLASILYAHATCTHYFGSSTSLCIHVFKHVGQSFKQTPFCTLGYFIELFFFCHNMFCINKLLKEKVIYA